MALELAVVWLYGLCVLAGFIFQSVLPSNVRILVYPLSAVLGFLSVRLPLYALLAFNIGMVGRAVVGRYWHCVAIEAAALLLGIAVAFFV
jgi:hypothetical protein